MSGRGSGAKGGLGLGLKNESTVTAGRMENYSEIAAINIDFTSKLFYMYREVVLLLIISFPQNEVSNFLFGVDNASALVRFFNKRGGLTIQEFDKIVWFLVNSEQYVSHNYHSSFFNGYSRQYLNSKEFNAIQASKSISIIICRYLFTIIRTNQHPQKGGMDREPSKKSEDKQELASAAAEAARLAREEAKRLAREEAARLAREEAERQAQEEAERQAREEAERQARLKRLSEPKENRIKMSDEPVFAELKPIVDDYKYIVYKCDIIEGILDEPYLNHNNIDPIPPELTSSGSPPPPPPVQEGITNEGKIDDDLAVSDDKGLVNDVLTTIVELPQEEGRRKCSRFVQLAEAKKALQQTLLDEANKKKQIALELAIKAKQELDEALANAAGQTYIGINIIIKKYHPNEQERIIISDSKLLPILAMKQKAIETGARNKLQNNIIPNKVSVVKFLVELGLLSASGDINDDDEEHQGGGAGPNFSKKQNKIIAKVAKNQIGNSTKVKNEPKKKTEEKQKVADPRGIIEGIGAQNQCGAAIGSLEKIPRVKCYICGELGKLPNMKTMECEHIFCVGLAAQYFGLLRATSFSEEQKNVLSILYAWAHRCCNQLKSNLSFMKFKSKPNDNEFEFYETNAKELLRNIYDNTVKYDCRWVDVQIKKTYPTIKSFVDKRTAILGRYCRPLIQEINEVKSQLFHYNPQLFSFMSILKVAATTLVLLTGDKGEQNQMLYLKSTDTIPLCRLLLLKDLETKIPKQSRSGGGSGSGSGSGGDQRNKLQYGGTFDKLSVEEVYNANWGQLMKFMIQSTYATRESERVAQESYQREAGAGSDFDTIIHIMNANREQLSNVGDIRVNLGESFTHTMLVDAVNAMITEDNQGTGKNNTPIDPNGTFYVFINPQRTVKISATLREAVFKAGLSAENTIHIHYYPPQAQQPLALSLNAPIFRLLALNHKINPYSLIAALLYKYSDEPQPDNEYIQRMLPSIMTIIPPEYQVPNAEVTTREEASVLLLLHLVSTSSPLPRPNIKRYLDDQETVLSRIQSELLQVPSQTINANDKQALCMILLILHPDELPADDSTDGEIIQDILTFIHDDNKNAIYSSLITRLLPDDITRFKIPQPPQEDGNDYKSDGDDDDDNDEGDDRGMVTGNDRQNNSTIVSRIRNLLIVIAGVYLAYGKSSFNEFNKFVSTLYDITASIQQHTPNEKFKIWLNKFTEHLNSNIDERVWEVWEQIASKFCSDKLTLFTNEPPMSPITVHGLGEEQSDMSLDDSFGTTDTPPQTPPHRSFASSFSPDSVSSSQPLSPSTDPPPQRNIDDHLVYLLPRISESIFTDNVNASVFDGVDFNAYLVYFTKILIDANSVSPNTKVILKKNPPIQSGETQDAIQKHIQQFVNAQQASSGGKANKKKSTKRRTPRHRQHKRSQYSKRKRNTSSKIKKRLSIKHKKSQLKYHDTRKRRK